MQTQIEGQLRDWSGPPLVLVQPKVEHISMFAFDKTAELIEAGYRATAQTLDQLDGELHLIERGMHPTRRLRVLVDEQAVRGVRHLRGAGAQGVPAGRAGEGRSDDAGADLDPAAGRLRAQLPDRRDQRAPGGDGGVTSKMNTAAPLLADRHEVAERAAIVPVQPHPAPRRQGARSSRASSYSRLWSGSQK